MNSPKAAAASGIRREGLSAGPAGQLQWRARSDPVASVLKVLTYCVLEYFKRGRV